jgi:hypothetical protein
MKNTHFLLHDTAHLKELHKSVIPYFYKYTKFSNFLFLTHLNNNL